MKTDKLKQRFKEKQAEYSESTAIRIHRALSWLHKAETTHKEDIDSQFIYLWISFNSAYAQELDYDLAESENFNFFIQHILALDKQETIHQTLFKEFTQAIRLLLDNKYVYQPFWNYYNQNGNESADWETQFTKSKHAAQISLLNKETGKLMSIIFSRLYTLRNQILHGGATYGSRANRDQLKDACKILSHLMMNIVEIMIQSPQSFTGQAIYPYIKE